MHQAVFVSTLLAIPFTAYSTFEAQYLGPTPYLAFSDPAAGTSISPFSGLTFSYFHLEDFEDGTLNTPGVSLAESANESGTPTSTFSDSVDGDDGVIDGIATGTQSLFSNFTSESFTFDFSETTLGSLPTHAGIVWTDIGRNNGGTPFAADLIDNVVFEAFGPDGQSLGLIGPFSLGDTSISRTTGEDRFLGVIHLPGISSIRISMPGKNNWEVDHLQYGFSDPPPDISIARKPDGNVQVDYIGTLESNPGLAPGGWSPVDPKPSNPFISSPSSEQLFFRASRPD